MELCNGFCSVVRLKLEKEIKPQRKEIEERIIFCLKFK